MDEVVLAFLDGGGPTFSNELHIEDNLLFVDRMSLFAVRIGDEALLVRRDVDTSGEDLKGSVEDLLREQGLRLLEADTRLGDVVAIQMAGIRGGSWDLWGRAPERAAAELHAAVLGDDTLAAHASGPLGDLGPGLSLEEILGEDGERH